ncbi:MAG: hypothetical protein ACREOO_12860 [bacterium]
MKKTLDTAARCVVFTVALLWFVRSAPCNEPQPRQGPPRVRQPQIHVLNPGFELGSAYWKELSAGVVGASVSADAAAPQAGRYALEIDLQKQRRLEKDGAFYLITPWLTLQGGGEFSFSIYAKSVRPGVKMVLRVFNATSNEGMSSGRQNMAGANKEFTCTDTWTLYKLSGTLPPAEKDNYRFALKFPEAATYWIDSAEILHNQQPCTIMPDIEAALQPGEELVVRADQGKAEATLLAANHSATARKLRLVVKQLARMHRQAPTLESKFEIAAQDVYSAPIQLELPHADVYDLMWELFDENGRALQSGQTRVAAASFDLPKAPQDTPVWGMHLNSRNLEQTLPVLRAAGIRHLRNLVNLHWDLVEPQPGQWQWPDSLLEYLQAQDFHVLGKLGFTPKWAVPPEKAKGWPIQNKMPASLEDYRRYVRTVITRYGQRVPGWEIWNEPNLPRYFDGTAAEYGTLMASAASEIRAVLPDAEIAGFAVAKFFSPDTPTFVSEALAGHPKIGLNAFSFHPYWNKTPEQAGLAQRGGEIRALFHQQGQPEPDLWITEYGCQNTEVINLAIDYHPPLRPLVADELTYAAYLLRTACLSRLAGVKYFFCYSMDSERFNRSSDLMGLLEEGWASRPKPALLAYLALAQLLGDAKFEARETTPDSLLYLLHFRRTDNRRTSVLWAAEREIAFALPEQLARAEAFDMLGNRKVFQSGARMAVNGQPLFFVY